MKTVIKKISFLSINLKMLRKMNSMSQEDLSKKIGVKRSSVGAYEEDRADPKTHCLILISDYFGVTIDDLLKKEIENVYPKKEKLTPD